MDTAGRGSSTAVSSLDSGGREQRYELTLGETAHDLRPCPCPRHAAVQVVGGLLGGLALVVGGEAQEGVVDDDLAGLGQALHHLQRLALALGAELQALCDVDRADLQADARDVLVPDGATDGLQVDLAPRRRHAAFPSSRLPVFPEV